MSDKLIIVVIPCWNESLSIFKVCQSFGFCSSNNSLNENIHLVLIDNNSSDNTFEVLEKIQKSSNKNSVTLGSESQKGPIPARICGLKIATRIAIEKKVSNSDVIILQADADVIYSSQYINLMIKPFLLNKTNILVEGCLVYPKEFRELHPEYIELCEMVDSTFFENISHLQEEVIVTDSISGYLLSDYYKWGGFNREFDKNNEEVLAETTKLFIKAKLQGAKKIRIKDATAEHSYRKIIKNPDVDFVTTGFPRSEKWISRWKKYYKGPSHIKYFNEIDLKKFKSLDILVKTRKQYLFALFKHLTDLIMQLNSITNKKNEQKNIEFKNEIPSKEYLILYPGKILEFVLNRYISIK